MAGDNGNGFNVYSPSSSSSTDDVLKEHGMLAPFDYAACESPEEPFIALRAGPVSCFCVNSEESPMELVVKQKALQRHSATRDPVVVGSTTDMANKFIWDGDMGSAYDVAWPLALNTGSDLHDPWRTEAGYTGDSRTSPCKSRHTEEIRRNLSTKFARGVNSTTHYAGDPKRPSPAMNIDSCKGQLSSERLSPEPARRQCAPGLDNMDKLSSHIPTMWSDQCLADWHPPSSVGYAEQRGTRCAKHSPSMDALTAQLPVNWSDG